MILAVLDQLTYLKHLKQPLAARRHRRLWD